MKKVLLPMAVLAVSAGYVWSQQGQVEAALTTDAALITGVTVPGGKGPADQALTSAATTSDRHSVGGDPSPAITAPSAADTAPALPFVATASPTAVPPIQQPDAAAPIIAQTTASQPAVAVADAVPPQVTIPLPRPRPQPPTSAISAARSNGLRDGVYDGPVANAYYGLVHVAAVIQGGRLTGVKILSYPSDRRTSRYLNGFAMPALQQEALQAQAASVSFVSGATLSSHAFQESLAGALRKARG